MKRYLILLLALICLTGCAAKDGTTHEHPRFSITLPDDWDRVDTDGAVCFAPNGRPEKSDNIVFYVTEKNYYFSDFTREDYATQVKRNTGCTTLTNAELTHTRVDGWRAHRVTFDTKLSGKAASIVLYAVDADMTYFFILLDLGGQTEMFDAAMRTVKLFTQ
ncbi:MAG: hypothetical protein FWE69_07920 [Clostridiales bacterium]|nr:hypothetical protein [Clostridiales bacterium]